MAGIFLYDFYFFIAHRTCHWNAFLYRHVHALHHSKRGTVAWHEMQARSGSLMLVVRSGAQSRGGARDRDGAVAECRFLDSRLEHGAMRLRCAPSPCLSCAQLRAHPLSRLVYNIVIIYLIVELHCGYDFPWMLANVVPGGLFKVRPAPLWNGVACRLSRLTRCASQGARTHAAHHLNGRSHHQKFFGYLDSWFGPLPPASSARAANSMWPFARTRAA